MSGPVASSPVRTTQASLLGVTFVPPPLASVAIRTFLSDRTTITATVERVTEDARKRQHRGGLAPWDALTYLERMPDAGDRGSDDESVARELMGCSARGQVDARFVKRLESLPSVRELRVRLEHVSTGVTGRLNPRGAPGQALAPFGGLDARSADVGGGIARHIELDLMACGVSVKDGRADWPRLVCIAALALFRGDLGTWVETGFLRTRRCAWERCRSWFRTRRMTAGQKFCCTSCRVMYFQNK